MRGNENQVSIVELLESRRLLSAAPADATPTIELVNGTLIVNGTPGNDTIALTESGGALFAQVNSDTQQFIQNEVVDVVVQGFAGNDSISIGIGVSPTYASGMAGNDTIVDNSLLGCTLSGGVKNDSLVGGDGSGTDLLLGRTGDDTLTTGSGPAVLRGNAGNDSLNGGGGAPDHLYAGTGSDTMLGSPNGSIEDTIIAGGGDSITRGANDSLVGVDATDTVGAFG